ncbi:hypothetical protein ABPG72_011893 [Tetrahymena utriculariae]
MGCIATRNKFLKDGEDKDVTSVITNKKKIVLAGLKGSGKTSILQRLKHNTFIQAVPEGSSMSIEQISIKDDLDFLIYDIDHQNKKQQTCHLAEADAVIYVIDSTDIQNMWRVKEDLTRISNEMRYSESVVLVLFNKFDLEDALDANTMIQETGVHSELDLDVFIQKCSAKSGQGLQEGLDKLINYFVRGQKSGF